MPKHYLKLTLDRLSFYPSQNYVYLVANGMRRHPEIERELYWLALENMLAKIING